MKFIAADRVKIIEVPHIEGLRIPEILEYAEEHCEIGNYLPDTNERSTHPESRSEILASLTEFLFNIVYSLLGDRFKQFVNNKIMESNNKLDDRKGNKFSVLPSMAKVFADSNLFLVFD